MKKEKGLENQILALGCFLVVRPSLAGTAAWPKQHRWACQSGYSAYSPDGPAQTAWSAGHAQTAHERAPTEVGARVAVAVAQPVAAR
jgi:hypothetical protein